MAGTLPPTALLLTLNEVIILHADSYIDIARYLGISIDDQGNIKFMDTPVYPSYCLNDDNKIMKNHFTKTEALQDWARNYMAKNLPNRYVIYRYMLGY